MLYLLAEWLQFEGLLNLVRYQTARAGGVLLTALLIGLVIGPRMIAMLRVRQGKGQPIREDGPQTHLAKRGTPTMGGLMILVAMSISLLLWMALSNPFIWACLAVTGGFGLIGFMDDYDKVTKKSHKGVSGKTRLALEFAVAGIASWIVVGQINTFLYVPFFNNLGIELGWFYYVFAAFVIVGAGNAVNLTDGLDGLAFLWFNAPPAAVFMGDTGSLALGGALGAIAVATHHEVVLAVVGGLFVFEALSVIIQVFWFKRTGKRVFRMAPIHHHFEQLGWSESKVVIRFWIVAIVLAILGLATLKLR